MSVSCSEEIHAGNIPQVMCQSHTVAKWQSPWQVKWEGPFPDARDSTLNSHGHPAPAPLRPYGQDWSVADTHQTWMPLITGRFQPRKDLWIPSLPICRGGLTVVPTPEAVGIKRGECLLGLTSHTKPQAPFSIPDHRGT